MSRIREPGWLNEIDPSDAEVFKAALTGLYKLAAVDLVREQIEQHFMISQASKKGDPTPMIFHPYDIVTGGLMIWPNRNYEHELFYPLDDQPVTHPRPRSLARTSNLGPMGMELLVFHLRPLDWNEWRKFWDDEQSVAAHSTAKFPFQW